MEDDAMDVDSEVENGFYFFQLNLANLFLQRWCYVVILTFRIGSNRCIVFCKKTGTGPNLKREAIEVNLRTKFTVNLPADNHPPQGLNVDNA